MPSYYKQYNYVFVVKKEQKEVEITTDRQPIVAAEKKKVSEDIIEEGEMDFQTKKVEKEDEDLKDGNDDLEADKPLSSSSSMGDGELENSQINKIYD